MGYIEVLPEFGLVADPFLGVVTSMGESLAPVIDQVAELELIANDIVGMLSGEGKFLSSFPNREKALPIAGGVTAFWYGMAVGLFIAGFIAFGFL
ncbi:MAG: tetrahydromethanopterin S-methyltransferase subunit B [Methanomicrobiaceae archaeon]|nr:tetrahydromethanopterin S-methyltransferase subunit B [Methanomicrobiaceae archaeon]